MPLQAVILGQNEFCPLPVVLGPWQKKIVLQVVEKNLKNLFRADYMIM